MVRIIAGSAKGRKIKTPRGMDIRITLDKVKGAIFNMLGNATIDAHILDLFSGTGSLGIEALSRGAGEVVFVERDINRVKLIKENLELVGFSANIIRGDVYNILEQLQRQAFNIVLADPPYNKNLAKKLLLQLGKCNIMKNSSLIAIEHSKREVIEETPFWKKLKENRYGDTLVSIYKYINEI